MATMLRKLFTFCLAFGLASTALAEVSLRDRMSSERTSSRGYAYMLKASQKQAPKLFKRAAGAFQKALKQDPGNVMAQAGLADSLALSGEGGGRPASGVAPLATKDGRINMEALSKRLAASKMTVAGYTYMLKGQYDRAESAFKRAMDKDSGYLSAQRGAKDLHEVKTKGVKIGGKGDDKEEEEEDED